MGVAGRVQSPPTIVAINPTPKPLAQEALAEATQRQEVAK
jgi:hypothetical protein